jgi:chaperone protein EcpD
MNGWLRRMMSALFVFFCTMAASSINAGVVIGGTRFVYPSQEKEVTVKLINQGRHPVLVKTWIDQGEVDASPEAIKAPFTLTPPIFRMDADKEMMLRLAYVGGDLPKDRESLFWLNVMEMPPRSGEETEGRNFLQLAFRYRLKLFFRPEGLAGTANQAAAELHWVLTEEQGKQTLRVFNNSPYFVSLTDVKLKHEDHAVAVEPETVAPFSTHDFVLKTTVNGAVKVSGAWSVDYRWIDEWGGLLDKSKPLER